MDTYGIMGDTDHMPKVNISNDKAKLSQAQVKTEKELFYILLNLINISSLQLDYMKILEKQNIERVV